MTTTVQDLHPEEVQPYEGQRLDAALGNNFHAEHVGNTWFIDCPECGTFTADDIEEAVALIETHRTMHDTESRQVWAR